MKIDFRIRISFLAFVVTLVTFLSYLILEDIFWIDKIAKANLTGSFKLGRILIGFSLAMIAAVFVWYGMGLFYHALYRLSYFTGNLENDHDLQEFPQEDITGELARSIRLALFRLREDLENKSRIHLLKTMDEISLAIQQDYYPENVSSIPGFDISMIPKKIHSLESDYLNIIQVKDGLIGIIAGFASFDITKSVAKARIDAMLSLATLSSETNGLQLAQNIAKAIRKDKHKSIHTTICYIHKVDKTLHFTSSQNMKPLLVTGNTIKEISNPLPLPETENREADWNQHSLQTGDCVIFISDKILNALGFHPKEFAKEISVSLRNPGNTRELAMQILGITRHKKNQNELLNLFGMLLIKLAK